MHIPAFPPDVDEWLPGNPADFEPPVPRWMMNPKGPWWLDNDTRDRLEKLYGYWAVRRAETNAPVGNVAQAEAYARRAYESQFGPSLPPPPVIPPPTPPARRRRA